MTLQQTPQSATEPSLRFDLQPVHRLTARHVADLLLAGDPQTVLIDVAFVAVTAIEDRDAALAVLNRATAMLSIMNDKLDAERGVIANLREELRSCRAGTPRRAA